MPKPDLNRSDWPLVTVSWPREISAEDIDAHFEEMAELIRQRRPFAIVMSLTEFRNPTATLRRRVAERLDELAPEVDGTILCNAHVVRSTLARGILTAIYWLSPPPFETKIFTDAAKAEDWAKGQLHDAGLLPRSSSGPG